MEYLKLFENHTEYETFVSGETMVKPNVSHCVSENDVHYNPIPHDYSKDYFTIESLEDNNTIYLRASHSSVTKTVLASTDNGATWTEYTSSTGKGGTTLAILNKGDKLLVKGENSTYATNFYNQLKTTGQFEVYGNIMSLVSGDSFANADELTEIDTFNGLFYDCAKLTSAENLILPATILASNCYNYMFYGCTSLTVAPELPATTLANNCYDSMFWGCSSLTVAPELPATTLAIECYANMFNRCTSLTTAPELPATTLGEGCYVFMFTNCQNLANAPSILPATTLADASGEYDGCYLSMFNGCTSLTTAPELPATTLTKYCYRYMFSGCTSLNSITCLATDISASSCTSGWVTNVASSGTFTKAASMNDWTTGVDGIPNNWTTQDAS